MGYIAVLERKELQKKILQKKANEEAKKLSKLLHGTFEYDALYLIGSLIKEKGFHHHSDIDLVIKGLRKDYYFKALALLIKNSSFPIDLKPWEELDADRKAKVEAEGVIIC